MWKVSTLAAISNINDLLLLKFSLFCVPTSSKNKKQASERVAHSMEPPKPSSDKATKSQPNSNKSFP
jgi:hypothetical protein